jgi:hypothetical protein
MLSNHFTVTTNRPGAEVFHKAPFASYYFLTPTIVVVLVLLSALVLVARFGSMLSLVSEARVGTGCVGIVILWARGLRDWLRIRSAIGSNELIPGTPLYLVMSVAAAQICYGLTFLGIVAGVLFLVIAHPSGPAPR